MKEDLIQLTDIIRAFRRHLKTSAMIVVGCLALSVVAAFVIPQRFKATAVLNIPAAYFQIPLVSDLIATVSDPGELRAQRESLLRIALSDAFIDKIAEKHKMFRSAPNDRLRVAEREAFIKGVQYFSVGATSYQISVSGKSAEQAYDLTKSVLDQMVGTLVSERLSKITRTKNAIEGNLNSLRLALTSGKLDSNTAGMAREQLAKSEEELASLEGRFTKEHPTVVEQRRRTQMYRERVERLGPDAKASSSGDGAPTVALGSKKAIQEMYDEFVRKFNYLNVVLDMEKDADNVPYLTVVEQPQVPASAYFPKKRAVVMVGLAAGLVIAFILAVFQELKSGSFLSPASAAETLDVPYLGMLPTWKTEGARLLLEDYSSPQAKQIVVSPKDPES